MSKFYRCGDCNARLTSSQLDEHECPNQPDPHGTQHSTSMSDLQARVAELEALLEEAHQTIKSIRDALVLVEEKRLKACAERDAWKRDAEIKAEALKEAHAEVERLKEKRNG